MRVRRGIPERLLQRLDDLGAVLARRGDAIALIGLGSVGVDLDRLDDHSDLDFFVIVEDVALQRYLRSIDWLEELSPVAVQLRQHPRRAEGAVRGRPLRGVRRLHPRRGWRLHLAGRPGRLAARTRCPLGWRYRGTLQALALRQRAVAGERGAHQPLRRPPPQRPRRGAQRDPVDPDLWGRPCARPSWACSPGTATSRTYSRWSAEPSGASVQPCPSLPWCPGTGTTARRLWPFLSWAGDAERRPAPRRGH